MCTCSVLSLKNSKWAEFMLHARHTWKNNACDLKNVYLSMMSLSLTLPEHSGDSKSLYISALH